MKSRIDITLLTATLWAAALTIQAAELDLAAGPEDVDPIAVGERAPSFAVYEVDGSPFEFDPTGLERPTLIITFRGGWCPFCNAQLNGLRHVIPDLRAGGMDVLFLSADRPEILYSSLQQDTQDGIDGLDYHILSDADLSAASALGIAYRVPEGTLAAYESRGRDMGGSSITKHGALPLPAIFIVDTNGDVRFSYSKPDIRVRLPAEEVRAAAEPYLTRQ